MQSRYYDPLSKRFVSADAYVAGVGGEANGYNLFTYCFNNPVNMFDFSGNWPQWVKSTVKWPLTNIINPLVVTVQESLAKVDVAYSNRISLSVTPGIFIFNFQIGIAMDTKGNCYPYGADI